MVKGCCWLVGAPLCPSLLLLQVGDVLTKCSAIVLKAGKVSQQCHRQDPHFDLKNLLQLPGSYVHLLQGCSVQVQVGTKGCCAERPQQAANMPCYRTFRSIANMMKANSTLNARLHSSWLCWAAHNPVLKFL